MAEVTITWSPQTIGDDQPRPGTFTFHATFFVVDQLVGMFLMPDTPRPSGPRNWGQVVSAGTGLRGAMPAARNRMNARGGRITASLQIGTQCQKILTRGPFPGKFSVNMPGRSAR